MLICRVCRSASPRCDQGTVPGHHPGEFSALFSSCVEDITMYKKYEGVVLGQIISRVGDGSDRYRSTSDVKAAVSSEAAASD